MLTSATSCVYCTWYAAIWIENTHRKYIEYVSLTCENSHRMGSKVTEPHNEPIYLLNPSFCSTFVSTLNNTCQLSLKKQTLYSSLHFVQTSHLMWLKLFWMHQTEHFTAPLGAFQKMNVHLLRGLQTANFLTPFVALFRGLFKAYRCICSYTPSPQLTTYYYMWTVPIGIGGQCKNDAMPQYLNLSLT